MMMLAPLTKDVWSNIFGSMSLACWMVVYAPQVWENYQLQSGEGLSVAFVILWLAGDLTGLAGSIMAGLIPSVIILAVYYTACDVVLLGQVYYYRRYGQPLQIPQAGESTLSRAEAEGTDTVNGENTPLLRTTSAASAATGTGQPKPLLPPYLEYPLLLLFVIVAGLVGWVLTDAGDEVSIPEKPGKGADIELEWKSQTLGWASAVLYLGSRFPQIIHNFKTRCAGLSLAMFFFTISGSMSFNLIAIVPLLLPVPKLMVSDVTYSASILLTSTEPRYIIANLSWLVGALATIAQDVFVLGQFVVYAYQDKNARETKMLIEVADEYEGEDEQA